MHARVKVNAKQLCPNEKQNREKQYIFKNTFAYLSAGLTPAVFRPPQKFPQCAPILC